MITFIKIIWQKFYVKPSSCHSSAILHLGILPNAEKIKPTL